jgi:ABC-type Zn2+ transport system substrate-binding protein/surface adhesin
MVKALSAMGYKTQVQPLSHFYNDYGLKADEEGEEEDEEDEDGEDEDDEEDGGSDEASNGSGSDRDMED